MVVGVVVVGTNDRDDDSSGSSSSSSGSRKDREDEFSKDKEEEEGGGGGDRVKGDTEDNEQADIVAREEGEKGERPVSQRHWRWAVEAEEDGDDEPWLGEDGVNRNLSRRDGRRR